MHIHPQPWREAMGKEAEVELITSGLHWPEPPAMTRLPILEEAIGWMRAA